MNKALELWPRLWEPHSLLVSGQHAVVIIYIYLSSSCTPLQTPDEPQRILEQPTFDNVNIDSVELMWEFPGGTVDNYIVQYVLALDGFASDNVRSIFVIGSETSVVIGNLLPGSSYKFRVAVMNNHGISAFSQPNTFTTLREFYPLLK